MLEGFFFFWVWGGGVGVGGGGVINLIHGGFPNKKGRGRQKSEKLTSGGYLFATGKYLRAKP